MTDLLTIFLKKAAIVITGLFMSLTGITDVRNTAPLPTNFEDSPTAQLAEPSNKRPEPIETTVVTSIATSSAATTTTESITIAPTSPDVPVKPSVEPVVGVVPASIPPSVSNNNKLNSAVVNLICISHIRGFGSISGSGVIIDPRGVVLTNAHIGQYFLLSMLQKKGSIECMVRTGNPTEHEYEASLLYISSDWIQDNYESLGTGGLRGTGENDLAILLITKGVESGLKPSLFPSLPFNPVKLKVNTGVVLVGYPAEFLPSSVIAQSLYSLRATSTIEKVFTFEQNTVDLVTMKGGVTAQRGSSGGAVVDKDNTLVGLITTASSKFVDDNRNLYAITSLYIDNLLRESTDASMSEFLNGDLGAKAIEFSTNQAPKLEAKLMSTFD